MASNNLAAFLFSLFLFNRAFYIAGWVTHQQSFKLCALCILCVKWEQKKNAMQFFCLNFLGVLKERFECTIWNAGQRSDISSVTRKTYEWQSKAYAKLVKVRRQFVQSKFNKGSTMRSLIRLSLVLWQSLLKNKMWVSLLGLWYSQSRWFWNIHPVVTTHIQNSVFLWLILCQLYASYFFNE